MRAPVEWIPEVAEAASCLYDSLEPETALARRIHRLGTDRRLASVWRTLADHCGKKITALSWIALACCDERLRTVTRKELEETAARFRWGAQHLHHLVGLVRGHEDDPRKQVLRDAAKACEELASAAVSDVRPDLVTKRKVDPQARGFVVHLSAAVNAVCGQPFDKLVGTIAMVALDLKEPVSRRTVEYWRTHCGS